MHCVTLRALAALSLLSLLPIRVAIAQSTATFYTTMTSTTTVLTITTTITAEASTYASTSTETETMVAGSPSQPTGTAAPATGAMSFAGDAFQAAVLNSTNYYRAQHQANALTWDPSLAQYAQSYAQKCIWQHSGGSYGENIAEGCNSPTLAIDAWAAEEKHYDYEKPKFHESTGHYTQLVWKNTTTVGCGAVQCSNSASNGAKGWYVVCEYSPPGNVAGQYRQEVTKQGEGQNDRLGFGGAGVVRATGVAVGALVAGMVLLAMLA